MAFMKFYVGNEANASSHRDGIYIAIDTKKIFYNGDAYGGSEVDLSNYATKDDLSGYLPLTGGVLTTTPDNVFDSPYIQLNVTPPNAPWVEIRAAGLGNVNSTWIRETGINIGDYITDGPGYHMFTTYNKQGLYFYNMYGMPGSASFTRSGITIDGKTTSDLLHAAGGTISINELKSQLNIPDTSALQGAIGTNTYTGANYISKETNLTEAVLQLDEEIKATNDNLALEHTNAEATYAKKTALNGYLPLTGGSILYKNTWDSENVSYNHIHGLGIWINNDPNNQFAKPYASLCRQGQDDFLSFNLRLLNPKDIAPGKGVFIETQGSYDLATSPTDRSNVCALAFGNPDTGPSYADLVITQVGIFIKDKTSSDLLNAAGGTVSIQDILSQVTIPKATTSTLGGIKVGDGLEITDDGTLNCTIDPGSGSVSWGNITGKPSVFATNINSINDLNSGWDALLKAAPNIPSLDGYATQEWVNGKGFLTSIPSEYVTDTELNAKGFLTKATADGYYQPKGNYLTSVSWSQISGKPEFATVATSGSYNDLTNKPNIPNVSAVNSSGVINLIIDRNTLSFRSDGIAFNGSAVVPFPVVEVLSTEEINNILNS